MPDFTLTDDEVLALASQAQVTGLPSNTLAPAVNVMHRIRARAEDILNEQRAARR